MLVNVQRNERPHGRRFGKNSLESSLPVHVKTLLMLLEIKFEFLNYTTCKNLF